jgi:hypothetical protein
MNKRIYTNLSKIYTVLLLAVTIALLLLIVNPALALADTNPVELAKAVEEIEYLDQMRSGLAATLDKEITPDQGTFKKVCQPVGMQAKKLSQENGWQVQQIARKYRNPDHAAKDLQALMAVAKFEQNPQLIGFWNRENRHGQTGTRYYRRIDVQASCLACHGAKNNRPDFVKNKYPQDLAYDFKVGDLRGMYAVFIPDLQKALETD